MQTIYKRFSVVAGFILLLLLLAANAVVLRRQLDVQIGNQAWVTHTRLVALQLVETESLLKDAETGQRGYLYTGDRKYLGPYDLAVNRIGPSIDKLAQLVADSPSQAERVPVLRRLTQQKLDELAETIALYRAGRPEGAKAIVDSDAGLLLMDGIRQLVAEMEQEETGLTESRATAYQHSVRVTIDCIYLASILAALGLGLLAFYILREMALRERHAAQIKAREEWFRVTLTSIGEAVIATDAEGCVTFLNPLAERLTGTTMAQARGRAIQKIFPIFNEYTRQPVENPIRKAIELGQVVGLANHTVLQHTDGSFTPIEDSAAPIWDDHDNLIGVVLVFRDATKARRSEEVLRKTEKLAAAARLSATVAHEINNPLEAVGNLVYIVKHTPGVPANAVAHLAMAEQELDRVSHITRQTLGFYRESSEPGEVDLPALVQSILTLYSNKLRSKSITVECAFEECPPVQGLAGELKQAVSNLIGNAADAVGVEGKIWLKLSCHEGLAGKWVHFAVADDGPGVPVEHMERIFEPFFTTKKDVGTGLGLWVTKEIVDRHGGKIEVLSRNGDGPGALFEVVLPAQ